VGVWAGDDSPSKRDRQPSLCVSAGSPSLLRTGAACTYSRQPSKYRHGGNLVSALNPNNCRVSVDLLVDFVNLQFVTYIAA